MVDSLLTKYRPNTWDEVVGHDAVINSLPGALAKAHAFLFIGPPGTGKTTLARIAAAQLKCAPMALEEVDAATRTGIDDVRPLAASLQYQPFDSPVKVVICDECHQFSKSAWNSLLKIIEEPPPWVYWFFCTTEANKVPESIKTRCLRYELKPVPTGVLLNYLDDIAKAEKLKLAKGVIDLCAKEAGGSPRQALANLGVCLEAADRAEAAELLASAAESEEAVALARALYSNAPWSDLTRIIAGMDSPNPESVRHVVRAYGTKIVLNTQKERVAGMALEVLEAFSEPFPAGDGVAPLLLACGKLRLMS